MMQKVLHQDLSIDVLSKSKKKHKVEKAVCEKIVLGLEEELTRKLEEEMVKTKITYQIIDTQKEGATEESKLK